MIRDPKGLGGESLFKKEGEMLRRARRGGGGGLSRKQEPDRRTARGREGERRESGRNRETYRHNKIDEE